MKMGGEGGEKCSWFNSCPRSQTSSQLNAVTNITFVDDSAVPLTVHHAVQGD